MIHFPPEIASLEMIPALFMIHFSPEMAFLEMIPALLDDPLSARNGFSEDERFHAADSRTIGVWVVV